jgi:hypothetical protein
MPVMTTTFAIGLSELTSLLPAGSSNIATSNTPHRRSISIVIGNSTAGTSPRSTASSLELTSGKQNHQMAQRSPLLADAPSYQPTSQLVQLTPIITFYLELTLLSFTGSSNGTASRTLSRRSLALGNATAGIFP